MRVAINARILLAPRTGIGEYVVNLVRSLSVIAPDLELKLFDGWRWRRELPDRPLRGYARWSGFVRGMVPRAYQVRRAVEQHRFQRGAREHAVQLYHDPSLWPYRFGGPFVMTVHDLTHVHYPETQPMQRLAEIERHVGHGLANAARIIVDSAQICREIREHYGISAERIVVAPLGHAERFHPRMPEEIEPVLRRYRVGLRRYLLCVGTLEPRKNLALAVRAYSRLPERTRSEFPLLIAGAAGWGDQARAGVLRDAVASGHVRLLGYESDETLAALLAGAKALVYPSRYEGFGLPVLEALASGTPVASSNADVLREVAGDAALYFDPDDDDGCRCAIETLLEVGPMWERLRERGLARANQFSWQRCASITLQAYRDALTTA